MPEYSVAQMRDLDCTFLRDVLGFTEGVLTVDSHQNAGAKKRIRVFMKENLIHHLYDASGEFRKCYKNGKDDADGLATIVPPFSSEVGLTASTLLRLGFVIWPCLPERDGREGVMFLQHEHGIIDEEAFHLVNTKGIIFENVSVGACVSSIMYVNGDLPSTFDPCSEGDDEDELDLSS